jgi:small subunit ribosomal protein S2
MEKGDLHVIDLNKTSACLQIACDYVKDLAVSGKRVLFVGTKEQAKDSIVRYATKCGMPYVSERWLGGTLTNFVIIKKLIKKWQSFEKTMKSPAYEHITKKEQLLIQRERSKLSLFLVGLNDVSRLPSAIFVVDVNKEHIAVKEARALGITVIGIVDTNSNPDVIDIPIPANDDSVTSIDIIVKNLSIAIETGAKQREVARQKEMADKESLATNSMEKKESKPKEEIKKNSGSFIKKAVTKDGSKPTLVSNSAKNSKTFVTAPTKNGTDNPNSIATKPSAVAENNEAKDLISKSKPRENKTSVKNPTAKKNLSISEKSAPAAKPDVDKE